MNIFFAILALALGSMFITLYLLMNKEIKNITSQLSSINSDEDTNAKILMISDNKLLGKLVIQINKVLEKEKRTQVEQKRMDKELRQAIANMAHDLRTPLTSIMGYIQLMGDPSIPKEEQEQYRVIVEKRAKSLQMLITSFYDLSRLEANEYNFEIKPINLTNILCEMVASFYDDFLKKGIEPIIDIDEKPLIINGDENAIRRVFSNLIQNMIKYAESQVTISLRYDKNTIITEFRNDTANLKEEDAEHLFERFFTGDKARTGQSTGLGLAITKQLVEQMGHKIYSQIIEGELSIVIKWKDCFINKNNKF